MYCDNDHKLVHFIVSELITFNKHHNITTEDYNDGFICDECELDTSDLNSDIFHCISCDYDKCTFCAGGFKNISSSQHELSLSNNNDNNCSNPAITICDIRGSSPIIDNESDTIIPINITSNDSKSNHSVESKQHSNNSTSRNTPEITLSHNNQNQQIELKSNDPNTTHNNLNISNIHSTLLSHNLSLSSISDPFHKSTHIPLNQSPTNNIQTSQDQSQLSPNAPFHVRWQNYIQGHIFKSQPYKHDPNSKPF